MGKLKLLLFFMYDRFIRKRDYFTYFHRIGGLTIKQRKKHWKKKEDTYFALESILTLPTQCFVFVKKMLMQLFQL